MVDQSSTLSSSQSGWRIGDVVEDLYEVRWQTQGGMGVVYRVHHRGWNMDLAVKTPRPELVSSPQRMADFETEAETWVGLGLHPHIVSCVYVRRLDGLPRVFAEWVEGGSLTEAIAKERRLYAGDRDDVLARILDIAIQFAWGLDHAHSRGLVHQDVKPANLMLTADWTAKVSDFGLAKARAVAGDNTTTVSTPGASVLAPFGGGLTPAYCSPEQASASHLAQSGEHPAVLSRATDVWSWAISVWEMFVGEPPCPYGGQAADEAFAAFRDEPMVEDPAIPAMPDPVAELLARCLDPDPTTRPRRMGDIADELGGLYQQLIGIAYPRIKPDAAGLLADELNNQALSLLDLGRIDEAEQLWQQALAADPQHLHAVYNGGLHQWRAGQITDHDLIQRLEAARVSRPGPDADRLLAHVHLERRDSVSAAQLLADAARAAPDDRALTAALHAAHRQPALTAHTLTGHTSEVESVAISADGHLAISGSRDKTVRVWDLDAGTCLRTLTGHTRDVTSVAVSADGRLAVTGSSDATVRVWKVGSGACLRTLTGHTRDVISVAVSADGRLAVSGSSDATVRVWDLGRRRRGACLDTLFGHTGWEGPQVVAVSADGRLAVSGSNNAVRVWDLGRRRQGVCLATLTGHTGGVESVAVSADGRLAVSGSGDTTVRVWDLAAGTCVRTLTGHADAVEAVAVSTARRAVTGSWDGTVRVWDLSSGACLRTLTGHTDGVEAVAVSADGRLAVTSSRDKTVRVWEVPTARGHPAAWSYTLPHSAHDLLTGAAAVDIAVRRAQTLLAAADGAGAAAQLRAARAVEGYRRDPQLVDLWRQLAGVGSRGQFLDAWPQRTLTGHTSEVRSVAVSADGRLAVSGSLDKTVRVWDLDAGTCLRTLTGHTSEVSSVAVSADGRLAVSGSWDKTVHVWDVASGTCLRILTGHTNQVNGILTGHINWVNSVAVSADGHLAVSGSNKAVRVWDVGAGECLRILTGHTDIVQSVAVSADGRLVVSGSNDKAVRVWGVGAGECLRILTGHTDIVRSVAVSADGRLAVSGSNDEAVRVWDLDAGVCLRTLTGHTSRVESVVVSADATVAVSGDADETVRVWDLGSGTCLRILTGHALDVSSVAVSADATVTVSGSDDETVRVWVLDWDYEFRGDSARETTATHVGENGEEITDVTAGLDESSALKRHVELPNPPGCEVITARRGSDEDMVYVALRQESVEVVGSPDSASSSASAPWQVGDVVAGLYEVRQMMFGGMSLVYRLHDRDSNLDLAVRTPRPELVASPDRLRDFEDTAQVWLDLGTHLHIVACRSVRQIDGLPRVFAQWVDGGSLAEAIESGRLYEGSRDDVLARVIDVATQVAWGLEYVHSRGVVHQDVKPRAVMLTTDGQAKVGGFHLARRAAGGREVVTAKTNGAQSYSGMTPAYCSPEQAAAAHIAMSGGSPGEMTTATDVWSWAISVWEMFCGEPPVSHGQVAAEVFVQFREDPWGDDPAIPAMPDAMADLLTRCFAPDAERRPSMGEIGDELAGLYERSTRATYPRSKPEFLASTQRADGRIMQRLPEPIAALPHVDGYDVVKELRRGGHAVIYLARHHVSGEIVALTMMDPSGPANSRARELMTRQIAVLSELRHRNIVAFREAGTACAAAFFTSEYCAGGSIRDLVLRHGPLPPDRAVPFALQALDGLDYLHTAPLADKSIGLVHGDINPDSILLARSGRDLVAKLGGFGLAKAFDTAPRYGSDTLNDVDKASLHFVARPQLINFRYASPVLDVWGMAASLYFMLTGLPPRDVPNGMDPIKVVLDGAAVPIRERHPNIPKRLAEVIDEALLDRPRIVATSAAEFAAALRRTV